MRLHPLAFKVHRWLGYAVGLQVVVWVIGGLIFAVLPFQDWVKSGVTVRKPVTEFPLAALARVAAQAGSAQQIRVFAGPHGPALGLKTAQGLRCYGADGSALPRPGMEEIRTVARSVYLGDGALLQVTPVTDARRLGIVTITAGRNDLWQASFDDRLNTRLYFEPECGEFLFANNDVWVLYDFFWRLHIMDYRGGEDFNNSLLRGFASVAFLFALSGSVLSVLALRRAWRRRVPSVPKPTLKYACS